MDDQIITAQDLVNYGIKVEENKLEAFLDHANETLQERIGAELTEELDDDQLAELVDIQDNNPEDSAGLSAWLVDNIGAETISKVYEQELDILLGELAENSENLS